MLALMLYTEARRPARLDHKGGFVPLEQQDVSRWDAAAIERAESLLRRATAHATFDRYQLEAAISSAHIARHRDNVDNDAQLELLYGTLVSTNPSVGAWLGLCATKARVHGPARALEALVQVQLPALNDTQPYWALRAELHRQADEVESARMAYDRAIDLTRDAAVVDWLKWRRP